MLFITVIKFDKEIGEHRFYVFDTADNTEQGIIIKEYLDLCKRNVPIFPRISEEYIRDLMFLSRRYKEKQNLTKRSQRNIEDVLPMRIMEITRIGDDICLASLSWGKLKYQVQNCDLDSSVAHQLLFTEDRYSEYLLIYYKNKLIFTSDVNNMLNIVYPMRDKVLLYGYTTDLSKKVYVYGIEIDTITDTITDIYKMAYYQTKLLPEPSVELRKYIEMLDDNWMDIMHPHTYSSNTYMDTTKKDIKIFKVKHIVEQPRLNKVYYMFAKNYIVEDTKTKEQSTKQYASVRTTILLKKPKYDKVLVQEVNKVLTEILDSDWVLMFKAGWKEPIESEQGKISKYAPNIMYIVIPYLNYRLKDLLVQMTEDYGLLELFLYHDIFLNNICLEYMDITSLRSETTKNHDRVREDKGIVSLKDTWLVKAD